MESVVHQPGTECSYDFVIRLQHGNDAHISPLNRPTGIHDGIIPAQPSEVHCLTVKTGEQILQVTSAYEFDLRGENPRRVETAALPFTHGEPVRLIERLYAILKSIPPEECASIHLHARLSNDCCRVLASS